MRRVLGAAVMVGVVVVSHGRLGEVLLETAAEIVGPIPRAVSVAVERSHALEVVHEAIRAAVASVDDGEGGVIVLADAYGGTAANVALQLVGTCRIEVVTGCNLPMLLHLKSACLAGGDLASMARRLKSCGRRHVEVASEVLRERERDG